MCLMCNALLAELVEEHQQERALSSALGSLLMDTNRLAKEAGFPHETGHSASVEALEDPCIECTRREADADAFGFFCSKECMDGYDSRVRRELRAERVRLSTPKKSVWDGDCPRPTLEQVMRREFERTPVEDRV